MRVGGKGIIQRPYAPYKDIFVRGDTDYGLVIFYKGSPNHWHRLDGPAVIEYNLSRIINEVLEENSDISETKITGEQNG